MYGNALVVQWLGLGAVTATAQVQSLVGELRSRKPQGTTKKKKTNVPLNVFFQTVYGPTDYDTVPSENNITSPYHATQWRVSQDDMADASDPQHSNS